MRQIYKLYIEIQHQHPEIQLWQIEEILSKKFGVSDKQIGNIINGRQWKRLHEELGNNIVKCKRHRSGENNGYSKLTEDNVRQIHKFYNELRHKYPELKQWQITDPIAKKYDISISNLNLIINGKSWHHIYKEFHQTK